MSIGDSAGVGIDRLRQFLNAALAVAQVCIIVIGYVTGGNANFDTRPSDESPVVPAEYAFVIWSLVYPACFAYAIFQALPSQRANALLRRIGFYTAAAFLGATLWAVAAQNNVKWLTVVFILLMFSSLTAALVGIARHRAALTQGERLLVALPIGLYAGWVTAAVFANVASVLKDYGFDNFGVAETTWATALVIVAGALSTLLTLASRGNVWYAAALVWAFAAIVVANTGSYPGVAIAAGISATSVVLALALVLTLVPARRALTNPPPRAAFPARPPDGAAVDMRDLSE